MPTRETEPETHRAFRLFVEWSGRAAAKRLVPPWSATHGFRARRGSLAERISRRRAFEEGWLSAREVRDATGLGHATLQERFQNAARDGLRVARLESGEWRLHRDDLARLPRRYEARGAPRDMTRDKMAALGQELASLRSEIAALRARLDEAVVEEAAPTREIQPVR